MEEEVGGGEKGEVIGGESRESGEGNYEREGV